MAVVSEILDKLTVPILVHHHDSEEHAQCEEENTINVVRDGVTNGDAESQENDASDNVEANTEENVSNNPTVIECPDYEDELRYCVDDDDDERVDEVGDEQSHRVLVVQ